MVNLYFVRHGETDFNRKGIVQGSGVDSDLNETGQDQAAAFFEAYKEVKFDKIFASELKRTQPALEPWKALGYEMEIHSGLNEFSWGIHEGVVPTPEQRADFHALLESWNAGHLDLKVERGESPIEAWERSRSFFDKVKQLPPQGNYLFCSHGRQLRIVLANLMGEDLRQMEKYKHSNTGLSILRLNPRSEPTLELLNDTQHLKNLALR